MDTKSAAMFIVRNELGDTPLTASFFGVSIQEFDREELIQVLLFCNKSWIKSIGCIGIDITK